MDRLLELGFLEVDLKSIINSEPTVAELDYDKVVEKEELLKSIGCNERQIRNIIGVNPSCLFIDTHILYNLIQELKKLGVKCIPILLDTNPNILTYDIEDVRDFINDSQYDGIEEAVIALQDNPFIIEEE